MARYGSRGAVFGRFRPKGEVPGGSEAKKILVDKPNDLNGLKARLQGLVSVFFVLVGCEAENLCVEGASGAIRGPVL